ncbi:putative glutathione S-transferase, Thioredoxin-like superfamily [Helianthus annuus]|nr:putative glutathione S-transferase, Thioredoxin-like superfamily [Helianthus annuus]
MATSIHLPTSFRLTVTTIKLKLKKLRHSPPKMSTNQTPTPTQTQLITSITKLIWGKSLPPQLLISTVRTTWSTGWHLMMSQLAPSDPSGSYTRPLSQFRTPNPQHLNPTSLHLYAALPCPWGHRTLIVRALKGLQHALPVSIASPGLDGSWEFNDTNIPAGDKKLVPTQDKVNGAKTLREVYKRRPGGAHALARNPDLDLSAPELKNRIDEWNRVIYPSINNGVYRCGFAQSQEAYDAAVNELFSALNTVNDHLSGSRYLCGDKLTLADVCLFTTLIRFDLVYNVMFKCTKKKVVEYQNLHGYMCDIYQVHTCSISLIFFKK